MSSHSMKRPVLISVFSDQRRTKSTIWSRVTCGTQSPITVPQVFFLGPHVPPSTRLEHRPWSGSSSRDMLSRRAARDRMSIYSGAQHKNTHFFAMRRIPYDQGHLIPGEVMSATRIIGVHVGHSWARQPTHSKRNVSVADIRIELPQL